MFLLGFLIGIFIGMCFMSYMIVEINMLEPAKFDSLIAKLRKKIKGLNN